jgi:translation initiation factor 3 subunit H
LLKIIQHSKQNIPDVVTGQLLGLEYDQGILEVTNCYPLPNNDDDNDDEDYQLNMMKYLRSVNVDNNTVGWYQSALLGGGSFLHKSIIDIQYHFQKEVPSSVVVVHDPFRTTAGSLAIKAYRLTDKFMDMYSKGNFSGTAFNKFNVETDEVFDEVRIKVHNAHLVHGFLYELREKKEMR